MKRLPVLMMVRALVVGAAGCRQYNWFRQPSGAAVADQGRQTSAYSQFDFTKTPRTHPHHFTGYSPLLGISGKMRIVGKLVTSGTIPLK